MLSHYGPILLSNMEVSFEKKTICQCSWLKLEP